MEDNMPSVSGDRDQQPIPSIDQQVNEIKEDIKSSYIPGIGTSYSRILEKVEVLGNQIINEPEGSIEPEDYKGFREIIQLMEAKDSGWGSSCSRIFSAFCNVFKSRFTKI